MPLTLERVQVIRATGLPRIVGYNENHDELGRFAESDSAGGSAADRVDKVYDSSASKTRENADRWNSQFKGPSKPADEKKVLDAVRQTLDVVNETTIPKIYETVKSLGKMAVMRAVNSLVQSGQLRLSPDTGSLRNWEAKGGDADLTFVDFGGAPMDILSPKGGR